MCTGAQKLLRERPRVRLQRNPSLQCGPRSEAGTEELRAQRALGVGGGQALQDTWRKQVHDVSHRLAGAPGDK